MKLILLLLVIFIQGEVTGTINIDQPVESTPIPTEISTPTPVPIEIEEKEEIPRIIYLIGLIFLMTFLITL